MDLSNRNTSFLTEDKDSLEKLFRQLVKFFGEAWLSQPNGVHRLQILISRRDPLSTIELLSLADAIDACSDVDAAWLGDIKKKIKLGDLNQQNGALSELMLIGMLRRHTKGVYPAPIGQKGYDAVVSYDDGAKLYISIKRFGTSSFEREFQKRSNQFLTTSNHKFRNRSRSVHSMLTFKRFAVDSDWSTADKIIAESGFPIVFENDVLSCSVSPLQIPGAETLSQDHYSFWHVISGGEHKNEQANFLEKVRQAASELERKVEVAGNVRTALLVHLHSTASLAKIHQFAEEYLKSDGRINFIILFQPYVVKEGNTTSLIHGLRIATNLGSSEIEEFSKHPLRFGALVGKQSGDGRAWKLFDRMGNTIKVDNHYFFQKGDYYVTATESGNGQAYGNASNPLPGIRQHLVFRGAVLQGLFPESDSLEIL